MLTLGNRLTNVVLRLQYTLKVFAGIVQFVWQGENGPEKSSSLRASDICLSSASLNKAFSLHMPFVTSKPHSPHFYRRSCGKRNNIS